MKTFFFALFCCLIFPQMVLAEMVLSEIMYDPSGTDGGYEWVEVFNTSPSPVTLTNWKLLENGTNHRINEFQGGAQVGGGLYAIVADNPANFLLAYPGYTGILFDSAFSLNNTGELVALVDDNTVTVDSINYSADPGADGTGSTLQNITNDWLVSVATPGLANILQEDDSDTDTQDTDTGSDEDTNNNTTDTGEVVGTTTIVSNPKKTDILPKYFHPFYTGALELPKRVIAGVASSYGVDIIRHVYLKDETHKNSGYFVWNMGDGTQYTRTWNEPIHHLYQYPGNYIVVLDWYDSIGGFVKEPDISFEKNVKAYSPDIGIEGYNDEGALGVHNATKFSFDISGWTLERNGMQFKIPAKTYLPAGEIRYFAPSLTGFIYADMMKPVALSYPNGKILHLYDPRAPLPLADEGVSVDVEIPDENTEEVPVEEANTPKEVLSSSLPASALFSHTNENKDFFASIPWWIWLIVGVSIVGSGVSILFSRGILFTTQIQAQEINDEEQQEAEKKTD